MQRVGWHSGAGLAAGGLRASATGSGLCRVDFLEGRWFRDRFPYERVEAIRLEEDVMSLDNENAKALIGTEFVPVCTGSLHLSPIAYVNR